MKKLVIFLPIAVFLLIIGTFACRHELPVSNTGSNPGGSTGIGDTASGASVACSAYTVYFVQSVLPLLTSGCAQSGCHDGSAGSDAGELALNNYGGIMALVSPGDAGNSNLISIVSSGRMPPAGHSPFSADQIAMLSKWINQGAQNSSCTPASCDTSNVTYAGTIVPILQTNCTGCHSGAASGGGGIDLTVYANVLAQVNSGKLWGDVKHLAGYHAMPLGGTSLSQCDLSSIGTWIRAGAPNN